MSLRVRLGADVMFRRLEEEAVLLDLDSQRYYGLDAVGTRLWELLAEDDRLDAALQILTVEFEVDPKRLRGDIEGFVDSLATSGLAVVEGRPGDDGGAETGA